VSSVVFPVNPVAGRLKFQFDSRKCPASRFELRESLNRCIVESGKAKAKTVGTIMNGIYYYSVLITVIIAVFVIGNIWFNKRPDPLVARHRFFTALLWVAALLFLGEIIGYFFNLPDSSPFKVRHPESAGLIFLLCLSQRSQLSQRLTEREKNKLK
jgi:hypothetical protein